MALSDNLIAYWPLDEASGSAIDAHGSNDLTETSGTIASATGKVGNCRDFEADDTECFTIADNADLSMGDIDFTLQAWVNLESKSNNSTLIGKWNFSSSLREYTLFYIAGSDRFEFRVTSDGATSVIVTANTFGSPSTGTWYLIHAWHDATGNLIGISVNAGTADTTSHSGGVLNGASDFNLGALESPSDGNALDGLLDEVAIWKRVLSGAERTELYNSGSGRDYAYITGGGGATVTPTTVALTTTRFAPTVSTPRLVTPATKALTLTGLAPTVSAPRLVTPPTKALTLATFAPTVSTPRLATPTTRALTTSTFAPTIIATRTVTPTTKALTLTTFAPAVAVGDANTVVPATATLTLSTFAPTVSAPQLVTPATLALTTARFAPTVSTPRLVTPAALAMALARFAPTILTPRVVVPSKLSLALTTYAPTIGGGGGGASTPPTLQSIASSLYQSGSVEFVCYQSGSRASKAI